MSEPAEDCDARNCVMARGPKMAGSMIGFVIGMTVGCCVLGTPGM